MPKAHADHKAPDDPWKLDGSPRQRGHREASCSVVQMSWRSTREVTPCWDDAIVPSQRDLVGRALRALGVERFVLAIHDVSFPSASDEEIGRGSPYTRGGRAFLAFARDLGFDGIQLGPQGQTSLGNPSPYDGSVFSRNVLSIALTELTETRFAGILERPALEAALRGTPRGDLRAHYTHAFRVQHDAVAAASKNLAERARNGDAEAARLQREVAAFAANAEWLAHDARFEAFSTMYGTDDFRRFPERDRHPDRARIVEVERAHADVLRTYALGQYVLHVQHAALRRDLGALGLRLYGDLQIGLSLRDRWMRDAMFLPGHAMGAPPSRTNPEGQPWGYPVLHPGRYLPRFTRRGSPSMTAPRAAGAVVHGVASEAGDPRGSQEATSTDPLAFVRAVTSTAPLAFVRARIRKLFAELDGVRVDHPHGLVCPWVYDASDLDPMDAVVHGARLFETPRSARHPSLGAFAIADDSQIDPSVPDYDDDHVRGLREEQIAEYATLFDVVMEAAREAERDASDVLCEVLSTCPTPLACIMARHGLARFRVTQKADLDDETDGYRGENAARGDWIMIGNHDTEPLRVVIDRWAARGTVAARAAYLATRLEPDAASPRRRRLEATIARDPRKLALAMFAELFVGPATNVMVFFADLFGETRTYNVPGLVSDANWSMRVPRDYCATYEEARRRGEALDVAAALALAIRARGEGAVREHREVLAALEELGACSLE